MDNSPRLLGKAMLTQSPKLRLATMTLRGKKQTLILSALDVCDDVSAGVGLLPLINLHLPGRVTVCSATSLSLANIFAPVQKSSTADLIAPVCFLKSASHFTICTHGGWK